jgi:predicted negative regulator of RcsB-dependent stress response
LECVARSDNEKQQAFGKYALPYSNFQLATMATNDKRFDEAKAYLNKAKDNYKDYELENRLQTQLKSLQRRIKYLTETPKLEEASKEKSRIQVEQNKQKQTEQKNFYLS